MSKELSLGKTISLEIARKQTDRLIREHPLTQLFWECTLRCNAACRHCGSDCKKTAGIKDMPLADFLKVLDNISPHLNPHKTSIIVTGGEPLVRNDLEKGGLEFYKRGFPWGMVTNGILLDSKRLDSLLKSGLRSVTVSLDGFQKEHEWMRGVPGCYDKALGAIKNIVKVGEDITYDVVTCANQKNFDKLPEFRDFLISIGVKAWRIFTVFPVGRAAQVPELQLDDFFFTKLMQFIKETRLDGKINLSYGCEGFLGGYELEVRDHPFHCAAGVSVASVLSDGSISACPSIRADYSQGNIYKDDFWEVWETRYEKYRDRSWMKTGECAACKFFKFCRGNGMHLRDSNGNLLFCHYKRLAY
jgi:radical SAM enzyme (rSAM/lipoprotein system)